MAAPAPVTVAQLVHAAVSEVSRHSGAGGGASRYLAADGVLLEAERQDPERFMMTCMELLADQQGDPSARQLAGLLLKTAVAGAPAGARRRRAARWRGQISEATKAQLRAGALRTLFDPCVPAPPRRAAGLCVAYIGAVDAPTGAWPELLLLLARELGGGGVTGGPPCVAVEVMRCLEAFVEELAAEDGSMEFTAKQALTIAAQGLRNASPEVRGSAARVARAAAPLAGPCRQPPGGDAEAGDVIGALLENCDPAAPSELREEALRSLAPCAVESYEHVAPWLDPLARAVFAAMDCSDAGVAVQAIEVWTDIAEHELDLHKAGGGGGRHDVVSRAMPVLLPALLRAIDRGCAQSGDEEADQRLVESASACLKAVARVAADACVGPIVDFAQGGFASTESRRRRAALLAFAAMQDGPSAQALSPLIDAALPRLLEALRAGPPPEAAAAALSLGKALDLHPASVSDASQARLFELCMEKLRATPELAQEICYCLDGLLDQQAALLPPEVFQPVVSTLLDSFAQASERRALDAILWSMSELFVRASDDCVRHMEPVLTHLRQRLEAQQAQQQPVDGAAIDCLRALCFRLGSRAAPHAEPLLRLFVRAAERGAGGASAGGGCEEQALRAAGTLASALGVNFRAALPVLWPALRAAVEASDEPDVCRAGLGALRAVVDALGGALEEQRAAATMEVLAELLHRSADIEPRLRAPAVACLGAVGGALGASTPSLEVVLILVDREVAAASASGAAASAAAHGARPDGHRRPGMRRKAAPAGAAGGEWQRAVLDAAVGAYEALVQSCLRSGRLPGPLCEALPSILRFACRYSAAPDASSAVKRLAVRLVGALAVERPADVAALAREDQEAGASIALLMAFGRACPNAAVRQLAASLAGISSQQAECIRI